VALNRGESGAGSEASAFVLLLSDSGAGTELGILVKAILCGDGGSGRDALKAMKGASAGSADAKIAGRRGQAGKSSRQTKIPFKGVNL
jgi:hypothetical protein